MFAVRSCCRASLVALAVLIAATTARAQAPVAAYVLNEAVSFGQQLATGWSVSYQDVKPNGEFTITFKNRIKNGSWPLEVVTPCWVDVKGNFATGTIYSVKGRGSEVATVLANTMDGAFRNAMAAFQTRWRGSASSGGGAAPAPKPPGDGDPAFRTGEVVIDNNYGGAVTIVLYHPADLSRVFAQWHFAASKQSRLLVHQKPFAVGPDWEIELVFGNGVRSKRRTVGHIGSYENGHFRIVATRIYNG
jgi:hypothetical protein